MKSFDNSSTAGNEAAIRRGKKVPEGDINLAWVKSPALSPDKNMIILDTSNFTQENAAESSYESKLFYANHLGVLQDENGNQVIQDEYPAITDEFSVEETYEISSDNEFLNSYIFAYRHISRYFHVDQESITDDKTPFTLDKEKIKVNIIVEDENGNEYLDVDGKRKYKIKLVKSDDFIPSENREVGVYRIWIFVDSDDNETLYLKYNKVELNAHGTSLRNQDINYREILNPQPYFTYVPEETDVVDFWYKDPKVFSTKSFSEKEQIIGIPKSSVDGYKVYVPRKAIQDPRIFQLFRWRINAEFQQRYVLDPSTSQRVIRAGIITNKEGYPRSLADKNNQGSGVKYNYLSPPTSYPYVFYNMEKSNYNSSNVKIINPISEDRGYTIVEDLNLDVINPDRNSQSSYSNNSTVKLKSVSGAAAKEHAAYWLTNINTVSIDDLKKFDVLFLDLQQFDYDMTKYIPKLHEFVNNGGSLYVNAGGSAGVKGFAPQITWPVNPVTGVAPTGWTQAVDKQKNYGKGDDIKASDPNDELFKGLTPYGGWDFNYGDNAFRSISANKYHPSYLWQKDKSYTQFFYDLGNNVTTKDGLNYWKTLFSMKSVTTSGGINTTTEYPVTVIKRFPSGGSIIFDAQNSIGFCNHTVDTWNIGPRRVQIPNYFAQINSQQFEGSYKFAWNWVLSTLRSKKLDSSDESQFASTWKFSTEWKPSWVINGDVLKDLEKNKYHFSYEPKDISNPNDFTWRRKLSDKTIKQLIDEEIIAQLGDTYLRSVSGSVRKYSIEITNSTVKVPATLADEAYPYAWTTELSPEFIIPDDFGPHVVKEDPLIAQYDAGQYIDKSYLPQKYNARVKATYADTTETVEEEKTTILARFKAKEILKNGKIYTHGNKTKTWTEDGSNELFFHRFNKGRSWGAPTPNAIFSRNELFLGTSNSHPYMGISGNYAPESYGANYSHTGDVVKFIQYSLNRLHEIISDHLTKGLKGPKPPYLNRDSSNAWYTEVSRWALKYRLPGRKLRQDGVYDTETFNAVKEFKIKANARRKDGIADSEFFAILGSQIQFWGVATDGNIGDSGHFETSAYNYLRYTAMPDKYMNLRNVSDASVLYNYMQISDTRMQADVVSDIIVIQYPLVYAFEYASIIPHLLGEGSYLNIDFVDVRRTRIDTTRFNGDMRNKAWLYAEYDTALKPAIYVQDPRINWIQGQGNVSPYSRDYVQLIQRAVGVTQDGVYGSATAEAVYRWKSTRAVKWGIPVNNEWGSISYVTNIQKLLQLDVTGYYDNDTFNAVTRWQSSFNGAMPIDGIWGPITQKLTDEFFMTFNSSLTQIETVAHHLPDDYYTYPDALLAFYDKSKALVQCTGKKAFNGKVQAIQIPQDNRCIGNTLIIGVSQTRPAGNEFGATRSIGISDFTGYGRDMIGFTTIDGSDPVINIEGTRSIEVTLKNGQARLKLTPDYTGPGVLTDIEWGLDPISPNTPDLFPGFNPANIGLYRIESSNPDVEAFIDKSGNVTLRSKTAITKKVTNYTEGRWLPAPPNTSLDGAQSYLQTSSSTSIGSFDYNKNPVYAMDENGNLFPSLEVGFVSKNEGIKLLCTSDGKPIGIPYAPSAVGSNEFQRHYMSFEVEAVGVSPLVKIGFYDKKAKEFIINSNGVSKLTYIEYVKRGPQNIYVGVLSEAETQEKKSYESIIDTANPLPFKYAMPVYGVTYKKKSKIGIDRLPAALGPSDIWPIPIRVGSFNRYVDVPQVSESVMGGWLSKYQGQRIQAFYSVPEADKMGWSSIFGRPAIDVVGENPKIITQNIIQLKQAPILMVVEPTIRPSNSDPCRPIFRVWTRKSISDEWEEIPRSEILDYNVSTGLIYLKDSLREADANLVKVNYTCLGRVYNVKQVIDEFTETNELTNLNPYSKHREDLIGIPVYLYIVPTFVRDQDGKVIADSIKSSTIRITKDAGIFNPENPYYNPLRIQLGIVYISPSLDINDLVILDTRRRGGGAADSLKPSEINNINPETKGYWDIGYGSGISVQSGGYVIVRLPKMLKTVFPNENDILDIVRKNISAGVEFRVEDMEGNTWGE
jgi:hypothetical protein